MLVRILQRDPNLAAGQTEGVEAVQQEVEADGVQLPRQQVAAAAPGSA